MTTQAAEFARMTAPSPAVAWNFPVAMKLNGAKLVEGSVYRFCDGSRFDVATRQVVA
jgi:hypothetical protein